MSCELPVNGTIGSRLPVRDAQVKVTGQLKYVADMKLPRMLHAKMLFSPVAHARIKRIDVSKAEALPGVRAVVTYQNTPDTLFNCCGETIDESKNERVFSPIVRHVGDRVAAVAADTLAIAEKAVRLIEVEYEELPFYLDPEEAMKEDAYPIHEGGNIAEVVNLSQGDVDAGMEGADLVYEDRYTLPGIHHAYIETHAVLADYDANGKLTVWSPTQDAWNVRVNLCRIFDMKMSKVRVVADPIGGGFGGKIDILLEHVTAALAMKTGRPVRMVLTRREDIPASHSRHPMIMKIRTGVKKDGTIVVTAALAMKTGRPVRMVLTRREDIPASHSRHPMIMKIRTGVKKDGTIVAQDVHAIINTGGYAGGTSAIAWAMGGKLFRMTNTPNLRFKATEVYTNTIPTGAMRGFGSPQLFFAQQRQINRIAKELGLDMTEMLLKNLEVYTNTIPTGAMRGFGSPQLFFAQQRQINRIAKELGLDMTEMLLKNLKDVHDKDGRDGTPLGDLYARECVSMGAELFDWKAGLAEQEASRQENGRYRIGVGMAVAAHGNGVFGVHTDISGVILKMNEDGTLVMSSGSCDMGNGVVTLQAQLISEILDIPVKDITFIQADTDNTLYDWGNFSSRGTYVCGAAAVKAGKAISEILDIPVKDITFIQADTDNTLYDWGNFSSRGTYVCGAAAVKAGKAMKQMLLEEAAKLLPEDIDRIELRDGRAWSLNYPDRSATLEELAAHARHKSHRDLVAAVNHASNGMAVSYGAHFVKVQVDTETGEVKPLDYVAVHDVGTPLNPMNLEGQVEGAIQMGLGYALSESIDLDAKGKVTNGSFRQYHIFTAPEMPPIRVRFVGKPEPTGPYGGKSIGECSVVPSPAAIANAVSNAVGGDYHDLPLRKNVVLSGLPK